MTRKTMPIAIFIVLWLMQPVNGAWGAENPLKPLADKTVAFFTPLTLKVDSINGDNITLTGENREKAIPGTRFDIFREGAMFYHPVTNEPLGHFENFIGSVEIAGVKSDGTVIASLIKGAPQKGDIARLSKSMVKVLFYQDKSIDWFLGDVYYRQLKATGRFELIDTSLDTEDTGVLFEESKKHGAEVLILIEGSKKDKVKDEDKFLRQRIFWVSDRKEVSSDTVPITDAYLQDVLAAADIFLSAMNEPVLSYHMPIAYDLMAIGDLDGDREVEIVFSSGSDLAVYRPGVDMNKIIELKGDKMSDNVYIDTIDINKDGKDEIIVTALAYDGARAFIYGVEGDQLRMLWKAHGFLRVYNKKLLFQGYASREGQSGDVKYIVWDSSSFKEEGQLKLPKGINLYDFVNLEAPADDSNNKPDSAMLYYDSANHLVVRDAAGTRIWRSKGHMGGFTKEYRIPGPTINMEGSTWHISDKMYAFHKKGIAVRRIPFALTTVSLGYKKSYIMSYWYNGISVEENTLVGGIPGSVLDYTIYKDRIYVLSRPILGLNLSGMLKGENPLVTNLYIYKLL
ncbi:MAG: VCBS repeat-containing protein [Nitrospirae bacterium]|nr:VCBS repeat-containing protein [Nitrospirota bacterium]